LLEAWFAAAAVSWAPTTVRQTRSVLDRYLHPHLGAYRVGDVTPATIYAKLRVCGSQRGTALSPGTLARVHVVMRSGALAGATMGRGCGTTPRNERTTSSLSPPELSADTERARIVTRLRRS